jgi:hypothetical protein
MKYFDFFRFKKKADAGSGAAPAPKLSEASGASEQAEPSEAPKDKPSDLTEKTESARLQTPPALTAKKPRKAIAILPYNNLAYFKEVLTSVLVQTIDGAPFSEVYELFVFQDGLQARHQRTLADYEAIKTLCHEKLPSANFMRQPKNIGTALQFAYVEQYIFETRDFDFCIFLEHDFVIAPGYLQTMESLFERFAHDERIAALSVHSSSFQLSLAAQHEKKHTYKVMAHDWGAGVFQRTWRKRLRAMQSYYKLLGSAPFEQRNNMLIQDWMAFMGFVKGPTSQDTIKACVDSGLQTLRITPFINQGTYIGKEGMHWTQAIYDASGYGQTVNYVGDYGVAPELSAEYFQELLATQCKSYLADTNNFNAAEFQKKLAEGRTDIEFSPNALSSNATAEDITAAYKLFLGRFPENSEVVQVRVGIEMQRILRTFMLSEEFLQRQDNWPIVVEAAKRVIELNKQAQASRVAAAPRPADATPPASV